MTKTVKYYNSDDVDAPQLLQTGWGHMINLYRKLCEGYNSKKATSILYDANTKIVKINFDESVIHGYRKHQTIKINLAESEYNDKEFKIIHTTDSYIQCQTKDIFTEDLAVGDINIIVSPLGMIHEYSSGNKSAFKFPPENGEDPTYLVINDTEPTQFAWNNNNMCATPSVYMCKNLDSINGMATDIVPYSSTYPEAYKSGEWKDAALKNYWNYGISHILYQGNMNGSGFTVNNSGVFSNITVKWILIGNQDFHYLYVYPNSNNTYAYGSCLYTFGKYTSKIKNDQYNYIFNAPSNASQSRAANYNFYMSYYGNNYIYNVVTNSTNNIFSTYRQTYSKFARSILVGSAVNDMSKTDYIGLKGITVNNNIDLWNRTRKFSLSTWSGQSGESYPPFDGKIKISKIDIYEVSSSIERGTLKGAYWIHHSCPFADKSVIKITDENNRSFNAICLLNNGISNVGNMESASGQIQDVYALISLDEDDWNE